MKFSTVLYASGLAVTGAFAPRAFVPRSQTTLAVAVGDAVPSVNLHSEFPPDMVDIADYVKGKSVLMVGLPGAFTPT